MVCVLKKKNERPNLPAGNRKLFYKGKKGG